MAAHDAGDADGVAEWYRIRGCWLRNWQAIVAKGGVSGEESSPVRYFREAAE
jgi:hypothetical protein